MNTYLIFGECLSRTSWTINPPADSDTKNVNISTTVLLTSHFLICYCLFTLHGTGTGTNIGNGTGTIGNNGSCYLSLFQISMKISTLCNTFHLKTVPDPVPFPASVNIPLQGLFSSYGPPPIVGSSLLS